MRESEALKILNIPISTLKEWSKPVHPKHKLYLLIKHTDAKQALRTITQNVPAPILTLLNRNIKAQEHFHNDEIFKLFSKKATQNSPQGSVSPLQNWYANLMKIRHSRSFFRTTSQPLKPFCTSFTAPLLLN